VRSTDVFLNVPFDFRYQPLFVALVGCLVAQGWTPRSVLEVPSDGASRLHRLIQIMNRCHVSIHDLSRVGLSSGGGFRVPRFNMPLELGMCLAVAHEKKPRGQRSVFVLESRRYRLLQSCSDLNGIDPHIHDGTQDGVIRCFLSLVERPAAPPAQLRSLVQELTRVARKLRRDAESRTIFSGFLFGQLVEAAIEIAIERGLLRSGRA
jgi:hypothetical protein